MALASLCAVLSGSAVGHAQTSGPVPMAPDSGAQSTLDQGRRSYVSMCARCHGLNLVSTGLGADLRQFPSEAKERFYTSVNKGVKAMPAWESLLKPGELDAIWAYVGSVNSASTQSDAK